MGFILRLIQIVCIMAVITTAIYEFTQTIDWVYLILVAWATYEGYRLLQRLI